MAHVITYDIDTTKFEDSPEGRTKRTQFYNAVANALESAGFSRIERSVFKSDQAGSGPLLKAMRALEQVPELLTYIDKLHQFEVTETLDLKEHFG